MSSRSVYDAVSVSAVTGLVTALVCDTGLHTPSLTLNLGRIIARGLDNLTNFGLPRTFRSRLIGKHLSDASRDLETLTFDLEGHGPCR